MYIISQTFYLDKNAFHGADSAFVSGVDLFFKKKPNATNNSSGITNPGVIVSILDTTFSGAPNSMAEYKNSVTRESYGNIATSTGAVTATTFTFSQPIIVKTNTSYSIQVKFEDPDYDVWTAKTGDALVGTNNGFSGFSNESQGQLFDYVTAGTVTPRASTQLKFRLKVAKFTANTETYYLTNKDFEFLTVSNQTAKFTGGEKVFQVEANATGTVSFTLGGTTLTGNGTNFSTAVAVSGHVVLFANSSTYSVRQVNSITNATSLTVTEPFSYTNAAANFFVAPVAKAYSANQPANTVYLVDSFANSSLKFDSAATIAGEISGATATIVSVDNIAAAQFKPEIGVTVPSDGSAILSYVFAALDGGSYKVNTSNFKEINNNKLELIDTYNALVMSRSNEVSNPTYLYGDRKKSAVLKVELTEKGEANNSYSVVFNSPYLYGEKLDMFVGKNNINNDVTDENTRYGNCISKHITTKITFDQGKSAEDALLYLTAYKPAGTDLVPYIKIHNTKDPEAFDDKDWTRMVPLYSSNAVVSSTATKNYLEYAFGIPSSPQIDTTLTGTVTTTFNDTTIVGSGTNFSTDLTAGDVIKVYSPIFPEQFQIALVSIVNSATSLDINVPIANNSLSGSGFKIDVLKYPQGAFINQQNGNIVRYYGSDLNEYDTFDTMQFKIDILSDNVNVSPRINNIRALGVSA